MATVGFRAQREWINERTIAIFVGTLGSAMYILSLLMKVYIGLLTGWLLAVPIKLFVLGIFIVNKRGIRYILSGLKRSWLSRGSLGILLLGIFGGLLILDLTLDLVEYSITILNVFYILSIFSSSLVLIYDGFIQSSSKSISFWCNGSLPILFVSNALFAALLSINSIDPSIELFRASSIYLNIFIILSAFSLYTFLSTSWMQDIASKESVNICVKGALALIFWSGVLLFLIFPLIVVNLLIIIFSVWMLYLCTTSALIGMYLITFVILKAGIFKPLIYPWTYPALGSNRR